MDRDRDTDKDRDKLPPLNALRNFEAVARRGSFAGAAADLHDEFTPRVSGTVRVNVLPSFTLCWLLPRLSDFQARYADIEVRVSTTSRKLLPPTG